MVLFSRYSVYASLQAILLILLHVLPLVTADPTPLDKLYTLVKNGGKGNCDSELSDLRTSYTEGLAMTQAAIDAIDAIKSGKSSNWVPTSKNNRKAKMLQALFNIKAASLFKSISSADSAALDKVRGVYSAAIDDANMNFEGLHWLYCNDDYLTHYNPEDEDPRAFGDNKPKVGEIENGRLKEFGGWYDGSFQFFKSKKAGETRAELFCGPGVGAFTIRTFQSITWCPNAFSGFSNGHKYVTSIGGIKADQKQIKKDDPLKNYESLASVWLHEWTHLQSSTADQPAYDSSGNSISGKSYGFFNCVNLARKGQSLAVANADTFAYFAMAMYLESWDWSNGFAENSLGM
ncbi:hypothetical protein N7G274_007658 [Stereocaulon virgatum]|uniref:Lysine-specific metallo-endopeptidase domain-containing protein n=1 Tax=Stereocaulon virgatum TaxID=373712 RepID=A0ABR4A4X3_9LECA